MKLVHSLNEHAWREFVDCHPEGRIYHTPEMFKVFERTPGHQPALWAVVDNAHTPLALLLPVQITLRDGLLYPWTTRSVVYGGALCAPGGQGQNALDLLLATYRRKMNGRMLFTELRNMTGTSNLQPILSEHGFIFEEHLNYLVDLNDSEENMWQRISKSGRQSVRSAVNKGTVIAEVTDPQQLPMVYCLLQDVYARVRVPFASIDLFEQAFNMLAPRDMLKIFLAVAGDQYIGTCVALMYKGVMIDWYAASDRNFSAQCPGELLIWHALQWGRRYGYQTFDFGGAGKPSEDYGPRRFKAKFNGELVNFGRNVCTHSPLRLKASSTVYHWIRSTGVLDSVFGRLAPSPVPCRSDARTLPKVRGL